ncbi:hypothetical protein BU14_1094s0001 [Porphyra umbilicalis]|uniref:Uncharacterized protein n=1 Tax=Porphyra umbilicalis TaxID=2786 RepID=A0A1X6NMG0_PORUM|nr:hypothetical protein BU14_1094s0001 [Porphyra umbilicalis]|eukprot:OSX69821.1 hypothetical protein BU14_1094s0001 [Porphyra umbilicalis]
MRRRTRRGVWTRSGTTTMPPLMRRRVVRGCLSATTGWLLVPLPQPPPRRAPATMTPRWWARCPAAAATAGAAWRRRPPFMPPRALLAPAPLGALAPSACQSWPSTPSPLPRGGGGGSRRPLPAAEPLGWRRVGDQEPHRDGGGNGLSVGDGGGK